MVFIACSLLGPNLTKRCISNHSFYKCFSKHPIAAIPKTLVLNNASLSSQPHNSKPRCRHLSTLTINAFSAARNTNPIDPRTGIARQRRLITSTSFLKDQNASSPQKPRNLALDKRDNRNKNRNINVPEPRPYNQTLASARQPKYQHVSRKKRNNTYTPPANDYVSYDDIKASMKKLETNSRQVQRDYVQNARAAGRYVRPARVAEDFEAVRGRDQGGPQCRHQAAVHRLQLAAAARVPQEEQPARQR
ncbi:hypothetical protein AYI69_g1130 [Smittium culicis]|uniref:Uncharacterized protein n=1 Tax=Smittium culicis TaxID=133412 RepID=A0A1R1YR60_9FUNG|nr:hypothetical protein AYI69_g1130 [Smittium culicis]